MTYILPQLDLDNILSSERARIKAAKTSTYRVDSAKAILDIDTGDLEYLLHYNIDFFNHTMKVADKVVAQIIRTCKEKHADFEYEDDIMYYDMLKNVETLDDVLYSCDYFGEDYEERREYFIEVFIDATDLLKEYFE